MVRETDILNRIRAGGLSLPPAQFRVLNIPATEEPEADAVLEGRWNGQTVRFLVGTRALATPKTLRQTTAAVREAANPPETYPMIVVPYLSPGKLEDLAAAGVSAVDLCGNGVLVVPGRMLLLKSGNPNRFPQSAKLRNVYRGKSSLVARAFLIQPRFSQVQQIAALLRQRGAEVGLSTVSKALARLEEDLIVSRREGGICLVQAEELLDKLASAYAPPEIARAFRGKCRPAGSEAVRKLARAAAKQGRDVVLTGEASAERYAVTAREALTSVYCSEAPETLLNQAKVEAEETPRFANLEVRQTADARVFFDLRRQNGVPFASPTQAYLELATGDKRQKDAAEQVRSGILAALRTADQKAEA